MCITVPQFSNRGYFITPKLESQGIEDISQSLYIKYKPLKPSDSIIIKYKNKDILGLPVTTPQRTIYSTWTSSTTLTTTGDISEAYAYLQTSGNECECEILNGAGAGQFPQITSITLSTGTYTITVSETVDGVVSGNMCNILIDNWKVFKTVNSGDSENWIQAPISRSSKWHKYKIELRGVETTIEELQVVNKVQIPAT